MNNATSKRRSRLKPDCERKRPKYVFKACASCKRRKVRCNGKTPCEFCERRSIKCCYSNEFESSTNHAHHLNDRELPLEEKNVGRSDIVPLQQLSHLVATLQDKVELLHHEIQDVPKERLSSVKGDTDTQNHPKLKDLRSTSPSLPDYTGPTSSLFSLGVAKMILEHGRPSSPEKLDPEIAGSVITTNEQDMTQMEACSSTKTGSSDLGLLSEINLNEDFRLIHLYDDIVGTLLPIVDIETIKMQAEMLWANIIYELNPNDSSGGLRECDATPLKMVIAIALLAEGGGYSRVAIDLHDSLLPNVLPHAVLRKFSLRGQQIILLNALFYMFQDDYRLASRMITIGSRTIIESGLHRKKVLSHYFPRPEEQKEITTLLYTSFVLDRQINFAAGLPFTFRDNDIDIPEVEDVPYLKAMRSYVQFGAQIWYSITDEHGKFKRRLKEETFDFLSYKVKSWQESLPKALQSSQDELGSVESIPFEDRKAYLIRSILFLRANQIRILVLRPLLYSYQTAKANPGHADTLVQLATNTINKVLEMDRQSNLYRTQIPILNHFLSSALCSLFLVLAHYSRLSTTEFTTSESAAVVDAIANGLSLLRTYLFSLSSQRLLRKFTGPQGLISHLGLLKNCNHFDKLLLEKLDIDKFTGLDNVALDRNPVMEGNDHPLHDYSNPTGSEWPLELSLPSPVTPGDISQLFASYELDFMGFNLL
ncbi:transcriptional regulator family: Fungal Specific TF [Penicillium roqueforti]|nr:transcriptional regulator family: Fungal Specific TF [Penicillium roqueforti]KAI3269591.1 transcriptional regulator family: Fungal Specific TF [Penicillium roqueforti]KAI3290343.1 transcriptional regulator family: Fungal Specific TF [Penicillium roqueforti]